MFARKLRQSFNRSQRWFSTLQINAESQPTSVNHSKNKSSNENSTNASQTLPQSQTREEELKNLAAEEFARRQTKIDWKHLKHESKIPSHPATLPFDKKPVEPCRTQIIDIKTLQLLERLSLVDLNTEEAFKNLKDSVEFAERVVDIRTDGVSPMYTVLEDCALKTRPDVVADGNIKEDILKNASVTEEDYFVAPPGNIPLEQKEKTFKSSGYVDVQLVNGAFVNRIKFLSLGTLLMENVRKECRLDRGLINSYVVPEENGENINMLARRKDPLSIFKSHRFRENLLNVKEKFQNEIPFVVKEERTFTDQPNTNIENFAINLTQGTLVSSSYFVNETAATEHFYKIQRERKIWWMKFSSNPGRYFLSDMSTKELNNSKVQTVRIKSKFNFGELDLETIEVVPLRALQLDHFEDFQLMDTRLRRNVIPAVIRSELCLDKAILGILMDSIENAPDKKISINRKIAPYQCSVFCFSEDEKILLELEELATHLANVIRKAGLAALNLRKCQTISNQTLIRELKEMDQIGVPYSIILEDESLQTGIMKLRSRDTGLSEIIHITDVPGYLIKIFNM